MDGQLNDSRTDDDDPGAGGGHDPAADLDLRPRTGPADTERAARRERNRRRPAVWATLAVVVAGIGFAGYKMLDSATLFFYNADEAVERRDDLGERRFRIQGEVQDDVVAGDGTTAFSITEADVTVEVISSAAAPSDLFEPGIPVVLEGRFEEGSTTFLADNILVKHSEEYEADNGEDPERRDAVPEDAADAAETGDGTEP